MKVTTFVPALLSFVWAAAPPASAKNTILVNRIGPSASELFVANADGTGERKLFPVTGFDYDASFSADGKWIVFTSERNSSGRHIPGACGRIGNRAAHEQFGVQ